MSRTNKSKRNGNLGNLTFAMETNFQGQGVKKERMRLEVEKFFLFESLGFLFETLFYNYFSFELFIKKFEFPGRFRNKRFLMILFYVISL